jgi:lipopolysaccharide transport system permease protein
MITCSVYEPIGGTTFACEESESKHGNARSNAVRRSLPRLPEMETGHSTTFNEIIIAPNRSWLRVDWRALIEFQDLLFLLVRRDFVARFKQTILGPAWFILSPLLTTLVFTVVFGKIAAIPTDGIPPLLFYLCSLLGWNYFAQSLTQTGATFTAHSALFSKVYFPRLIVPLSMIVSNVFAYLVQLGTFLAFYFFYKFFTAAGASFHPTLGLLALPLLILQTGALSLGVGLWISAITAKYRDFTHLLAFIIQLWMYATPVIYPLSEVSKRLPPQYGWMLAVNPMSAPVEAYRLIFFGRGTLSMGYCLISAAVTVLLLVTGVMIFQRTERTFIDTV